MIILGQCGNMYSLGVFKFGNGRILMSSLSSVVGAVPGNRVDWMRWNCVNCFTVLLDQFLSVSDYQKDRGFFPLDISTSHTWEPRDGNKNTTWGPWHLLSQQLLFLECFRLLSRPFHIVLRCLKRRSIVHKVCKDKATIPIT